MRAKTKEGTKWAALSQPAALLARLFQAPSKLTMSTEQPEQHATKGAGDFSEACLSPELAMVLPSLWEILRALCVLETDFTSAAYRGW